MYQVTFCHCQQLCFASTTLLCGHSLIPPRFYPFVFYFLFTSFVSNVPHLLLPLLLPSRTYTHAHSFAFLPFLPTVENARYFHRRAPRGQSDRERNQPDARAKRRFVRRASERADRDDAGSLEQPRGISLFVARSDLFHPSPPLTCYSDIARDDNACYSPLLIFLFFF